MAVIEEEIEELPRFAIQLDGSSSPKTTRLEYRLIDFSEERVWVEDEDDEEDATEEGVLLRFLFGLFTDGEGGKDGHWEHDTSVTVEVRLVEPGERPQRFVLTSTARADTVPNSRDAAVVELRDLISPELRDLYLLTENVTATDAPTVRLEMGSSVGVERGYLFAVSSEEDPRAISLLRAVEVSADSTEARVVRRWGTTETGGTAREVVRGAGDLRLDVTVDMPAGDLRPGDAGSDYNISGSLLFVAVPYAPVHGGGGVRFFSVRDETSRRDFGFGLQAFGGVHLYRAPRFRIAFLGGGNLDFVFRPDDNDDSVVVTVPSLWPAVEASVVIGPHLDVVAGAGYRFSVMASGWITSVDEEGVESSDAVFADGNPRVSTTGPFTNLGLRFCFF